MLGVKDADERTWYADEDGRSGVTDGVSTAGEGVLMAEELGRAVELSNICGSDDSTEGCKLVASVEAIKFVVIVDLVALEEYLVAVWNADVEV